MANVLAYNAVTTLAAGIATNIDVDLKGSSSVCWIAKNTGSNPLTAATVSLCVNAAGGLSATDSSGGTALATLASGASTALQSYTNVGYQQIRFTLTSTLGTTVRLEIAGND